MRFSYHSDSSSTRSRVSSGFFHRHERSSQERHHLFPHFCVPGDKAPQQGTRPSNGQVSLRHNKTISHLQLVLRKSSNVAEDFFGHTSLGRIISCWVILRLGNVNHFHDTIVNVKRKSLAPDTTENGDGPRMSHLHPHRLRKFARGVGPEMEHGIFGHILISFPSFHDCRIVDRIYDHIVNASRLQRSLILQIRRKLLRFAKLSDGLRLRRKIIIEIHVRKATANRNAAGNFQPYQTRESDKLTEHREYKNGKIAQSLDP